MVTDKVKIEVDPLLKWQPTHLKKGRSFSKVATDTAKTKGGTSAKVVTDTT